MADKMENFTMKKHLKDLLFRSVLVIGMGVVPFGAPQDLSAEVLTLKTAVESAQANDPWLVESRHSQEAVEARSVAAGTLPDPVVSVGLANLPIDTFSINQEPMTQIKLGVTQQIPRGDTLALRRKMLESQGMRYPHERQKRRADTVVIVGRLWLDAYKAQESIRLIEKDRPLFEQLGDVAEANYTTAVGKTQQQDLVRAQLELTRLDDRVTALQQKEEEFIERLSEWIRGHFTAEYQEAEAAVSAGMKLPAELPGIAMLHQDLYQAREEADPQVLYSYFEDHPAVLVIEQRIKTSDIGIELARQSYKPMWGVNAGYGYRDDPSSGDRPDFVSLGLSFDLPIFTKNRQDKEVQAAVSQTEAVKTGKWLLIRQMISDFEKAKAQLRRLDERQSLYARTLLPQMHEQAEASLTAYTNDVGDFAEVVRARIAELNAKIEALDIDVERQKTIINLNYYFMKRAEDIVAGI